VDHKKPSSILGNYPSACAGHREAAKPPPFRDCLIDGATQQGCLKGVKAWRLDLSDSSILLIRLVIEPPTNLPPDGLLRERPEGVRASGKAHGRF